MSVSCEQHGPFSGQQLILTFAWALKCQRAKHLSLISRPELLTSAEPAKGEFQALLRKNKNLTNTATSVSPCCLHSFFLHFVLFLIRKGKLPEDSCIRDKALSMSGPNEDSTFCFLKINPFIAPSWVCFLMPKRSTVLIIALTSLCCRLPKLEHYDQIQMKGLGDMHLHNTHTEEKKELQGRATAEVTFTSMKQKMKVLLCRPPTNSMMYPQISLIHIHPNV